MTVWPFAGSRELRPANGRPLTTGGTYANEKIDSAASFAASDIRNERVCCSGENCPASSWELNNTIRETHNEQQLNVLRLRYDENPSEKKGDRMAMAKKIIFLMILVFYSFAWGSDGKEITVSLTVPDPTWSIVIDAVYTVGNELWVISIVSQNPDMMGAQVISTVKDSLKLAVPGLPVKNFIIGKTWAWENTEPYTFIPDLKQIETELKSGTRLYPEAERSTDPRRVLNEIWQWESTTTPVEKIDVANPERYTILLKDEGKIQARFDCNRGGGEYEIAPGKLTFGPLISTRMACPEDTMDAAFMRDLQRVTTFFVQDSMLFLELPYDSGTMRFRPEEGH
ncbi:MAG: META domain-containing protein [Desulfobacteraceae bacterium]|jgi:heat shock protein HslJ|nr:META domain-containing protein [Desulfobacteraceae bacterium]MBC2750089.1 META domain-containing protein [Desulfobacteraceae bacterium]